MLLNNNKIREGKMNKKENKQYPKNQKRRKKENKKEEINTSIINGKQTNEASPILFFRKMIENRRE